MVSEYNGNRRASPAMSDDTSQGPEINSNIWDAFKVEDLGTPPMGWMPRGQLMDLVRAIDAKRTSDGKG